VGLYFGSLDLGGLRLSVEGSQLIGEKAKRNILTLKPEEAMHWFQGKDLQLKDEFARFSGFAIIRTDNGISGCGYVTKGKILNFLPKARQLSKRNHKKVSKNQKNMGF
jgi:NOL1/NOP2/fmu family ribosome biogenesis protein